MSATPKPISINVPIPDQKMAEWIERQAKIEGRPKASFIRRVLEMRMQRTGAK